MSKPISRRTTLGAGLAAALGGPVDTEAATPGQSARGSPASRPVRLSPEALLDSYVRLRARTDGKTAFGWLDALRYAVVDGEIHPICRVLSAGIQRFTKVSSERYEAVMLEVAHYVDMDTGALLDTLAMPRTGRIVKVPSYRTGPKRVTFGVAIDESETVGAGLPRKQLQAFAPVGNVRLVRSVSEPRLQNESYFVRHEEYGRVVPADPTASRIFYREWTTWRGPADLALDPKVPSAPCEFSYAALTSWRPWMQMGEVPGHTAENGRGSKVASLGEIPDDTLRLTERLHPDLFENPDRLLDSAPR